MKKIGPEYIRSPAKRCLDIVGGSAIGAGLSPAAVALAIETIVEHKNFNPFFTETRVGRQGSYTNFKFQTLSPGPNSKTEGGSKHKRASIIGTLVRKSGMDEMPQIIHVIRGDISLVGIRPQSQERLDYFRSFASEDLFEEWFECYRQNPGLTGEGQLYSNRFPHHTPDVLKRRMEIDIESFNNASIAGDLKTIARTPFVLLSPSHTAATEAPLA
ncbi:MAG TPA: sugar transferase [Candidatus Saccharimonadales bacterium]|nr:sugar transferase [Candidatus Saccharimonadales bacterium]